MKYVIGSGWWCDNQPEQLANNESSSRVLYGDESIRGKAFHHLWYKSIIENTNPAKILIVDSCSPLSPPLTEQDERIEFISLNENAGHSTQHLGKYSGWMRSVLMGLAYANCCNCDYFVYVEQDVLLKGKGIIEFEIANMKKPLLFGRHKGLVQPLQQSFFIIHRAAFEPFLSRIHRIKAKDYNISPERKFAIASSGFLAKLPEMLFWHPDTSHFMGKIINKFQTLFIKTFANFDVLKSGYGRTRPIDFKDEYYYFQHGTSEELKQFFDQ